MTVEEASVGVATPASEVDMKKMGAFNAVKAGIEFKHAGEAMAYVPPVVDKHPKKEERPLRCRSRFGVERMITDEERKEEKKKRAQARKDKGWDSSMTRGYQPLGELAHEHPAFVAREEEKAREKKRKKKKKGRGNEGDNGHIRPLTRTQKLLDEYARNHQSEYERRLLSRQGAKKDAKKRGRDRERDPMLSNTSLFGRLFAKPYLTDSSRLATFDPDELPEFPKTAPLHRMSRIHGQSPEYKAIKRRVTTIQKELAAVKSGNTLVNTFKFNCAGVPHLPQEAATRSPSHDIRPVGTMRGVTPKPREEWDNTMTEDGSPKDAVAYLKQKAQSVDINEKISKKELLEDLVREREEKQTNNYLESLDDANFQVLNVGRKMALACLEYHTTRERMFGEFQEVLARQEFEQGMTYYLRLKAAMSEDEIGNQRMLESPNIRLKRMQMEAQKELMEVRFLNYTLYRRVLHYYRQFRKTISKAEARVINRLKSILDGDIAFTPVVMRQLSTSLTMEDYNNSNVQNLFNFVRVQLGIDFETLLKWWRDSGYPPLSDSQRELLDDNNRRTATWKTLGEPITLDVFSEENTGSQDEPVMNWFTEVTTSAKDKKKRFPGSPAASPTPTKREVPTLAAPSSVINQNQLMYENTPELQQLIGVKAFGKKTDNRLLESAKAPGCVGKLRPKPTIAALPSLGLLYDAEEERRLDLLEEKKANYKQDRKAMKKRDSMLDRRGTSSDLMSDAEASAISATNPSKSPTISIRQPSTVSLQSSKKPPKPAHLSDLQLVIEE